MMNGIRTYSELIALPTFEERYQYLRLRGRFGEETFGMERYLNQRFYSSDREWLALRDYVILRDTGNNDYCQDLGMPAGHDIIGSIIVHHMNPVTKEDILRRTKYLLDPEYVVCTYKRTHDAIHFSDESLLILMPPERTRNDTCPWRR